MKQTRREFAAGALTLAAAACGPRDPSATPGVVNDITQLNPIRVAEIAEPRSAEDVGALVAGHAGPISIGGGRFSQGGQIASDNALFIDMRTLNRILRIDVTERTITVESGVTWRQMQEAVDPLGLSPAIMQSFCNFTVGGSLSVNCHGDYVGLGPVIESVKSIRIIAADGAIRTASRTENADLFRAAIGGYGGVGAIVEATLDLAENTKLERLTHRMRIDEYAAWHRANVLANDDVVLHHAVIYPDAYTNVAAEVATRTDRPLTIDDRLPPMGPPTAVERSVLGAVTHSPAGPFIHERIYDPLTTRPAVVWRNYEAARDAYSLEPASRERTTYVLQEYFVPVDRLTAFVPRMAEIFRTHNANVLNVSIRHTRADPLSLLSWARGEVYSLVIYYAQATTEDARERVGHWTRELVDAALAEGGSYYLPYQIHATRVQFLAAYPQAPEFFQLKRRLDPDYKFRNRLWEAYYPR
jgi:FAD/FMN-containing dehydrogenase